MLDLAAVAVAEENDDISGRPDVRIQSKKSLFWARFEHQLGLTELDNFDGLDFRSFFYDADSSFRDCT